MIHLTFSQLFTAITTRHLQELYEGDDSVLDNAELIAIGEIIGYLDIRYDANNCFDMSKKAEFTGIPAVMNVLTDITLYHLHARVMPDNVPTLRKERYQHAVNWLEKVASGYIAPQLPVKPVDPTTPLRYGNSSEPLNPYF